MGKGSRSRTTDQDKFANGHDKVYKSKSITEIPIPEYKPSPSRIRVAKPKES